MARAVDSDKGTGNDVAAPALDALFGGAVQRTARPRKLMPALL